MMSYPTESITIDEADATKFILSVPRDHPLVLLIKGWLIGHEAIDYLESHNYDVAALRARFSFFPKPDTVKKQLDFATMTLKMSQASALVLAQGTSDLQLFSNLIDEVGDMERFVCRMRRLI